DAVYFVRTVGEAQGARSLIHCCQRKVAGNARGAPHLDGAIDDPLVCGWYEDLDRRDVGARVAAAVHAFGTVDGHETRGLNVDVRVGDEALDELLGLELAAVHLAQRGALDHQIEGAPHLPDRVHAVIDPAGPETVLRGLMTRTRAAELVL